MEREAEAEIAIGFDETSALNILCDKGLEDNKFSTTATPTTAAISAMESEGNSTPTRHGHGHHGPGHGHGHAHGRDHRYHTRLAHKMQMQLQASEKQLESEELTDGYWNENGVGLGTELDAESAELASTIRAIALHLEGTLRAAKRAHLSCGEVLLPPDLLQHIARDIIRMAESEPCGLRGCLILLSFESGHPSSSANHQNNSTNNNNNAPAATVRKIGKIKCDKNTVNTFELNLLLREDLAPWYSRFTSILRNLTKGGTIVISPKYEITKKKLYRSH